MDRAPRAHIVVVMGVSGVSGVSGVGKSTVAKGLSTVLGWTYAEGDAFHSEANVAKKATGTPLVDDDRWPWLQSIGAWMSEEIAAGRSAVITCSALRRAYRDLLREGRPEVVFCHLVANPVSSASGWSGASTTTRLPRCCPASSPRWSRSSPTSRAWRSLSTARRPRSWPGPWPHSTCVLRT